MSVSSRRNTRRTFAATRNARRVKMVSAKSSATTWKSTKPGPTVSVRASARRNSACDDMNWLELKWRVWGAWQSLRGDYPLHRRSTIPVSQCKIGARKAGTLGAIEHCQRKKGHRGRAVGKRSSRRCREEQRRIYELFISGHSQPGQAEMGVAWTPNPLQRRDAPHGHFLRIPLSSSEPQRRVPPFPHDREAIRGAFPSAVVQGSVQ